MRLSKKILLTLAVLVTIDGGGHTIPGPNLYFPIFLGQVNRDFSSTEEIGRFFTRQMTGEDLAD